MPVLQGKRRVGGKPKVVSKFPIVDMVIEGAEQGQQLSSSPSVSRVPQGLVGDGQMGGARLKNCVCARARVWFIHFIFQNDSSKILDLGIWVPELAPLPSIHDL